MATLLTEPATMETVGDLLDRLGGISPARIRIHPPLGTATEQDVVELVRREKRLCELVDGVLVEKAMGIRESFLAAAIISFLRSFVVPQNLGMVAGADGLVRLFPGMIRIPDVAFYSWDRLPNRRVPTTAIAPLAPDLAVEVLSASNTDEEMARKRHDYFAAGVRLVWLVDPVTRTLAVYTAPDQSRLLTENDPLDGGDVLPGFSVSLRALFAELDRQGNG